MKKERLFELFLLLLCTPLFGQEIIWEDDFSEGLHGWTVETTSCNGIIHPNFGVWELTEGSVNGQELDFGSGFFRWSFINALEYSISFSNHNDPYQASTYGTVYARYYMNNGSLESDISASVFNASIDGDTAVVETQDGIVRWATNIELGTMDLAIVSQLIGADNPMITFSNGSQNFTCQSQDGAVVLQFSKISNCGNLWNWSPNGNVGYGILNIAEGLGIFSDTRENGVAVINTLFHNAQGDLDYTPEGNPVHPFVSELISPPIDVSVTEKPLALKFTQFVLYANTAMDAPGSPTSFSVSNDDGQTWSAAYDVNENLLAFSSSDERPMLPIKIGDVGDADEIRIKFTWAADLYFWALDDVAIIERPAYDMKVNADFYAIPPNVWTPLSQVEPFYFMADIQNNGSVTAENVVLNLSILNPNNDTIYNQNNEFGDIEVDELAENDLFTESLVINDLQTGIYRGRYALSQDALDAVMENDEIDFIFALTDTLFAKESGRTGRVAPIPTSWYIGNSFYVPNGENHYARFITFMVDNASQVVNGAGKVTTHLYETNGDVNQNGRISGNELIEVASNEYLFDGTEDQELINIPVSTDGEGVPLANGKHYLVVLQYNGLNNADQLYLSASEAYDYNASFFINSILMQPRYFDVVAVGSGAPVFFIGGFPGKVIPVIRLSIGTNADLSEAAVSVKDLLGDGYKIELFPNPVRDDFQLQLNFPHPTDAYISLTDVQGKLIFSENYKNLQHGDFKYAAGDLTAGLYYLTISTPIGKKIKEVIVVR